MRAAVIEYAGDEPLITYKEFEELEGASAHFGAIEGLDAFRGNNLVVYGRPLPPPYAVEDIACAIYQNGAAIRRIKGKWYPKRNVARRGHQSAFMTEFHPDARVEAVRWLICEAQIMQAVARSRYVREPVTVSILNGTPLPLRIDQVVPRDRMTRDWLRLYDADELDLSTRAFVGAHPAITKDERTAKRIVEERMEAFARQFAFVVEYRKVVPGTTKMAPGKASKKMVRRYPDCGESLFEGTERARQQNETAFVVREADWLIREGIEEFDVLEAGHLDLHVMGVLQDRLVQGPWPWAIGSAGEITGMTENCEN